VQHEDEVAGGEEARKRLSDGARCAQLDAAGYAAAAQGEAGRARGVVQERALEEGMARGVVQVGAQEQVSVAAGSGNAERSRSGALDVGGAAQAGGGEDSEEESDEELWPLVPPGSVFVLRDVSDVAVAAAESGGGRLRGKSGSCGCMGVGGWFNQSHGWVRVLLSRTDRAVQAVWSCLPKELIGGMGTLSRTSRKIPREEYRLDLVKWLPSQSHIVISDR
jgi:hypothetical protein